MRPPDPPTARSVVSVFGGPKVTVGSNLLRLSPYQAALVGAVFGSLGENEFSRTQLIVLLWEEDDSTRTRHRLSQLLYSLGRKTNPVSLVAAEGELIRPNLDAVESDIRTFRRELSTGGLIAAADLVRRGFLIQLPLVPTRVYEEWLDARRATLRSRVRERAAAQLRQGSGEHRWDIAEEGASILLALSPEDEDALRKLMWIRAMRGRIDEALAAYQGLVERASADDPGWQCEEETEELLDRIRNLRPRASPPPELRHFEPQPDPPLCGRDEELAVLSRIFASETEVGLSTVLIEGEAGIGKTRLAGEAIRAARLLGFHTLRARSSEFEQDIPFNPILGALDEHAAGAALNRLEDPWRSVLLALMPQFHWEDGPLPEVPYVQPGSVPRRMFEAIRRLVQEIAADGPLLLFFDDFQWADETSVAALEFLRRRWSEDRLVLMLAVRPEPLGNRSRAFQFARELTTADEVVHLELGELPDAAAEKLVRAVASRNLTGREIQELLSLGGRNPFFLLELTLEYLEGRMGLRIEPGDHLLVPASIRQVLERRLTSLEFDAQQVLDVLAVYGRDLSLDLLQDMCKLDREASLHGLDQLQRFRLIHWTGTGTGVRHGLIRHTAQARLTPARQALLHERIARALLRTESGSSPDELALHFDKAGITDEALKYALEAADRADAAGAVAEALRFLGMARRHAEDEELVAEIIGRLGHLHYLQRNLTQAAPLLQLASQQFQEQGKLRQSLIADVERLDALSRLQMLPPSQFLEEIKLVKKQAKREHLPEVAATALDVEVHALDRQGSILDVRRVLGEAQKLANEAPEAARCVANATLALHLYYGSPSLALTAARQAVVEARNLGSQPHLLKASARLTLVLKHLCLLHTEEGLENLRVTAELAKTSGDLLQQFQLPLNEGVWHLDNGDYARARVRFAEAESIIEGHADPEFEMLLRVNLGELALFEGEYETAESHFVRLLELRDCGIPVYAQDVAYAGLGFCAIERGKIRDADRFGELLPSEPVEWFFDRTLIVLFHTRRLRRLGRYDEALVLLETIEKQIKRRFIPAWIRLRIEEARLLRVCDASGAERIAEETLEVAEEHSLDIRAEQLRHIAWET